MFRRRPFAIRPALLLPVLLLLAAGCGEGDRPEADDPIPSLRAAAQGRSGPTAAQIGQPDSVSVLQAALDQDPSDAEAGLALAGLLERRGDYPQALSVVKGVRDNGAESSALFAKEGALHMLMGNGAAAVAPLQRALEDDPYNVDVMGNLGVAYAMTQRLPQAVETFEKLVELAPALAPARGQLGQFYLQMQRREDAERELQAAVDLEPDVAVNHLNLGMLRHDGGDLAGARSSYEKAIALDDQLAIAHYNLGMIEGQQGNFEDAERLIQRARQLDPRLPDPSQR